MSILETKPPAAREAAPGVAQIDVAAVNRKGSRNLQTSHQKIYPKRAHGTFRNIKWAAMAFTLGVYFLLPWIRFDRGPSLPNQAFLIDIANGRLYFFWLEIWPQELYLITGFLVFAALMLFLVTSVAGRVWCGYLCWQTVWTDLMVAVERFWQGDRNTRIRLDKEPWTASKIFKKVATHVSWLLIGAVTGGSFVLYFRDAPTLFFEFFRGEAPLVTYLFFFLLGGFAYLLGGIAREQVCIYMCPWPRIQGAMFDADSLLVTYRDFRGDPRGPHRKGQAWEGRGDCIDCKACIAVCPMGIDIRDGPQLECIQCALCIDACDEIMGKIGRPKKLITYDTFHSIQSEEKGGPLQLNIVRPRTMIYAGLLTVVVSVLLYVIANKTVLEMNVIPERTPQFVTLSDGSVRNTYAVKILNKQYEPHTFRLRLEGLEGGRISVLGHDKEADPAIEVVPDDLRELKVYVTVPPQSLASLSGSVTAFSIVARDDKDGRETRRKTQFRSPQQP